MGEKHKETVCVGGGDGSFYLGLMVIDPDIDEPIELHIFKTYGLAYFNCTLIQLGWEINSGSWNKII